MSIEGYSNAYSNNIEGNSTDSILQGEIDLINYNITDITFNGTNKTTIENDLTITGVLAIPAFSNVSTTLTNLNSSVSTINTTLTGISYNNSTFQDLTTIDNNLIIGTSKILSIDGFSNVKTTLENYNTSINTINTTLTDISYATDTTTVNNNLTLSAGKILSIPTYPDVESTLTSLSVSFAGITGITYDNTGGIDMTTISNNLTIGTGKTFSIPNFSNIETTLTTLTTNATGITYSAPYPLFIPQTTINQNLYLATNKKLICDQSWTKLYTTHDLTDSVGVGYFKGFMYNNGSVFTLSTVNPIDVYDGTSSEIVLKCGTQETIFGIDGMSLNWGTITLCTDIQLPDYASLTTTLDNFTTEITELKVAFNETIYTDDFIDGFLHSPISWTSTGTGYVAPIDDEIGYQGIITMTASNDRILYPTQASNCFYWGGTNRMDFFIRVNFSDTNVYFAAGLSDNNAGTGNTIIWDYQNGVGWGAYVNGTLASISSITMTTGDWLYGSIINTHSGTKSSRFYLKNMTTGQTHDLSYANIAAISLTAKYRPYFRVTRTGGGTGKSIDIDYVSINYISSRPVTPA